MRAVVRMLLIGLVATSGLLGVDGSAAAQSRFTDPGPQPPLPPCTCRADGRVFQLGETTCLRTPQGPRLARCVMVINNTSWAPEAASCPAASLRPLQSGGS